ncbi:MAG: hypothetical protein C0445_14000 [Polaromonas sp.]|nr:hypothetical protein [Polaromonas sp.]
MNTTAYPADASPRVGTALGELATALQHLLVALVAKVSTPSAPRACAGSRSQEAAEARVHADRWARTDPRMAADIYCAADRHELDGQ